MKNKLKSGMVKRNGVPRPHFSFTPRVIAVILMILILFLGWTFYYFLYIERETLFQARSDSLADQVRIAISLCEDYSTRVNRGELRRDQAMDEALETILSLRFGRKNQGHFYVLSKQGEMLGHPLNPDLTGTDILHTEDGRNIKFVSEIIRLSTTPPGSFVKYRYNWERNSPNSSERMAYISSYEPWNWLIVTDTTTTDIYDQIRGEIVRQVGILLMLILVLAGVISTTLDRLVLSGVNRLIEAASKLAKGKLDTRVKVSPTDELNALAVSFNRMAEGIQARDEQLRQTQRAAMFALAKLAESRDNETGNHLLRVREYASVLAHALRRDEDWHNVINRQFIINLYDASLLHDIGKVAIPDSILLKPDMLDDGERAIMMSHTLIGANTIKAARERMKVESQFLEMAEQIAAYHHERWDGTGYVKCLSGKEIPLAARIFTVADIYDALTTQRPYKDAYPHERAIELMSEDRGKRFDPLIFDVFLNVSSEFDRIRSEYVD